MRKIYLLSICLITLQVSAQWTQVGTALTGSVRGLWFTDENTGFAVGGDNVSLGYVARTSDGGVTWSSTSYSGTNLLRSIFFTSSDTGYTCGASGLVLKTTDGGDTWNTLYSDVSQYFRAVAFVSSEVGFLGGAAGTILKTSDAGATWTTTNLGETTSDIIQLKMVDATTGYAVASSSTFASGYVFKTSDGGDTWTQVYYDASIGFLALTPIDDMTVYVGGNNQTILKTTDGGSNWTSVYTGYTGSSFRAAAHATADKIYMVDDGTGNLSNGSIVSTEDAGSTWNDTSFTGIIWLCVNFPTSSVGYAANTVGGVYKLVIPPPPPPQWTQVGTAFSGFVRGLCFTSEDVGYAVGGDGFSTGYIAKTTDGGATWTSSSYSQSILLRSASFVNADTGYVCGHNGVLFQTTDAGANWTNIYTNATQTFRAVDFVSPQVGYLAGSLGTILKTTDGGITWTTTQLDENTSDVIQLDMIDASTGYAVCSAGISPFANGYVYKTTDGGDTWTQIYYDANTGLLGLAVVDAQTVYAGGLNQIIIKTSDGGSTWTTSYTGFTGPAIRCGAAASEGNVFFGDDYSYIFGTNDDGSTWNDTLLTGGLFGMTFPKSTLGYAGNGAGAIYKIELPCPALGSLSAITGSTTFCSGDTANFSVEGVENAEYYDWLLPEGSTIVSGSGTNSIWVAIGTNSGSLSVTASNDCDSTDAVTLDVTVNITPAVPTISFDLGVLSSTAPSGNQWYYNGNEIPGATDATYTPTANGSYYVIVTSSEGCSSQSEPYEVIGVGMSNVTTELPLTILPNPMNQTAQINIGAPDASRVIISDVQGKLILNLPVTSSQLVLTKKDLSDGMYMVQLLNDKNELMSRMKLIVQ